MQTIPVRVNGLNIVLETENNLNSQSVRYSNFKLLDGFDKLSNIDCL